MSNTVQLDLDAVDVYPIVRLSDVVLFVSGVAVSVASAGKIKSDYLPVASGTTLGIVKSADTDQITITSGGISIVTTTDIKGATTAALQKKIATAGAVQSFLSSSITSNYTDIKNAVEASTKIPNVYAVKQYKNDFMEDLQSELETYYKMSAGFGMVISGGTKVELARSRAVTTIPAASTTVTIQPGEAYVIDASTTSKTLNMGTVSAGHYGLDAHLEIFVANTGYVHVGSNVTLVDALAPDSVNNCIVRFHDGHAIISVEDHVGAYMVNSAGTVNSNGNLYYGMAQAGSAYRYIGFRSELNTSAISFNGVTAANVKKIVGNGTDVGPTLSGSVSAGASGITLRDVKLSNVTLTGGSMTLGYVNVVSGSTVGATTGTAIIQHAEGAGTIVINSNAVLNGAEIDCYVQAVSGLPIIGANSTFNLSGSGVLDLAGTKITTSGTNAKINITGMTITSGGLSTTNGGGFLIQNAGSGFFSDCLFAYNSSTNYGGAVYITKGNATLVSCSVLNNDATIGQAIMVQSGTMNLVDCDFRHARGNRAQNITLNTAGTVSIAGTCRFTGVVSKANASAKGTLIISSGAVIDLSGNSISVPIIPGGSIIINGACTVVNSAGVDMAVAGGTYTQITNAGAVS